MLFEHTIDCRWFSNLFPYFAADNLFGIRAAELECSTARQHT
jgi:hypothetical protein